MAFIDYRLSDKVSQGFEGGPEMAMTVVPNEGGHEARIANWGEFHWKYIADYGGFRPGDQNEIYKAFLVARAMRDSFRFKDWNDYIATNEALGTGDNTSTPRQLVKFYTLGPATFTRTIILPIASTLVVTANGSPIAVTVDDETGLVTPTSPWPNGQVLLASFQFDVRVRFGQSYYPFKMPAKNISAVSIDLVQALTP